jgi:hypothetical protein
VALVAVRTEEQLAAILGTMISEKKLEFENGLYSRTTSSSSGVKAPNAR